MASRARCGSRPSPPTPLDIAAYGPLEDAGRTALRRSRRFGRRPAGRRTCWSSASTASPTANAAEALNGTRTCRCRATALPRGRRGRVLPRRPDRPRRRDAGRRAARHRHRRPELRRRRPPRDRPAARARRSSFPSPAPPCRRSTSPRGAWWSSRRPACSMPKRTTRPGGRRRMTFRATVLTLFPEMFPGPARRQPRRPGARRRHLVARGARHPRLGDRPAPHRRRHAGRRRTRHGDARRCARRGDRRREPGRRRPAAPPDEPARPAARPGARRASSRPVRACSSSPAASRASTSG